MVKRVIHYVSKVKREIRSKIGGAIVAAFAFIMALVWRDAIKDVVDKAVDSFGLKGSGYLYTLIGAIATSIICVLGIMYFSRWSEK